MRVIDCIQRSEEWDRLRARPTASNFGKFVTPTRGDYSKSATDYACQVIARRLGAYVEPPPSFWMEWGVENEPHALASFRANTGREVTEVGFVMPDNTDDYGGSPDGLVGDDGLLEIKCPKPETLIRWHALGLPNEHRPQIQGLLWITGRQWCDFWAWHPHLQPLLIHVEADLKYQVKISDCMALLLEEITRIEQSLHVFGDCTHE